MGLDVRGMGSMLWEVRLSSFFLLQNLRKPRNAWSQELTKTRFAPFPFSFEPPPAQLKNHFLTGSGSKIAHDIYIWSMNDGSLTKMIGGPKEALLTVDVSFSLPPPLPSVPFPSMSPAD